MNTPLFELCCDNPDAVLLAQQFQVPRIELCSALSAGGITPSAAFIRWTRSVYSGELSVLIRPREGNFLYTKIEQMLIRSEILDALQLGADRIVCGALNSEGLPDSELLSEWIRLAGSKKLVFHRAIDDSASLLNSLQILIDHGVSAVLSSGGKSSAFDARSEIKQMVEMAAGRIEIMPGGGITPTNVVQIIQETGVSAIHASCSVNTPTNSSQLFPSHRFTDPDRVRDMMSVLSLLSL